jgi:hypothetical protein
LFHRLEHFSPELFTGPRICFPRPESPRSIAGS